MAGPNCDAITTIYTLPNFAVMPTTARRVEARIADINRSQASEDGCGVSRRV
jgi:hypothetical protein